MSQRIRNYQIEIKKEMEIRRIEREKRKQRRLTRFKKACIKRGLGYNRKDCREKLLNLIGDKCFLCGSKEKTTFHEIYGKRHDPDDVFYTLKHIDDFISLCKHCHFWVHITAKQNTNTHNIDMVKFDSLVKSIQMKKLNKCLC